MTDEELAAYAPKPLPPSMDYLRDLIKRHRQGCPQEIALDLLAEVERLRGWRDIAEEHLSNQLALERENAALREIAQAVAAVPDEDYDEECPFCKESPGYVPIKHT